MPTCQLTPRSASASFLDHRAWARSEVGTDLVRTSCWIDHDLDVGVVAKRGAQPRRHFSRGFDAGENAPPATTMVLRAGVSGKPPSALM